MAGAALVDAGSIGFEGVAVGSFTLGATVDGATPAGVADFDLPAGPVMTGGRGVPPLPGKGWPSDWLCVFGKIDPPPSGLGEVLAGNVPGAIVVGTCVPGDVGIDSLGPGVAGTTAFAGGADLPASGTA